LVRSIPSAASACATWLRALASALGGDERFLRYELALRELLRTSQAAAHLVLVRRRFHDPGLRHLKRGLRLRDLRLELGGVQARQDLTGPHGVVEIDLNALHDPRELAAHVHLIRGLNGPCRGHHDREAAALRFGGLEAHRCSAAEKKERPRRADRNQGGGCG
jgi:uncharacterized membrane protein YccC